MVLTAIPFLATRGLSSLAIIVVYSPDPVEATPARIAASDTDLSEGGGRQGYMLALQYATRSAERNEIWDPSWVSSSPKSLSPMS